MADIFSVIFLQIVIIAELLPCTVYAIIQVSAHTIHPYAPPSKWSCEWLIKLSKKYKFVKSLLPQSVFSKKCLKNWILRIINIFRPVTQIRDQWRMKSLLGGLRPFPTFSTRSLSHSWNVLWAVPVVDWIGEFNSRGENGGPGKNSWTSAWIDFEARWLSEHSLNYRQKLNEAGTL